MGKVTVAPGVPRYGYWGVRLTAVILIIAYLIYLIVRSATEFQNPLTSTVTVKRTVYPLPLIYLCDVPEQFVLVDISKTLQDRLNTIPDVGPYLASKVPPTCRYLNFSEPLSTDPATANPSACSVDKYPIPLGDEAGTIAYCYMFNLHATQTMRKRQDYVQILLGVKDSGANTVRGVSMYLANQSSYFENNNQLQPIDSYTIIPYDVFTQIDISTTVNIPLTGNYFSAPTTVKAEEPQGPLNYTSYKYDVNAVSLEFNDATNSLLDKGNLTQDGIVTDYIFISISVSDYYLSVNMEYFGFGPAAVLSAVGGAWSLLGIPLTILFVDESAIFLQFAGRKFFRKCNTAPPDVEKPPEDKEMFEMDKEKDQV